MNKPLISIISAVLNCDKDIHKTIASVLAQTYDNWEWIVMDGKSSDETVNILSQHASNDPRIKVYSES